MNTRPCCASSPSVVRFRYPSIACLPMEHCPGCRDIWLADTSSNCLSAAHVDFNSFLFFSCAVLLLPRLRCLSALRTSAEWRHVRHLSRPLTEINALPVLAWPMRICQSKSTALARILRVGSALAGYRLPTTFIPIPEMASVSRHRRALNRSTPPQLNAQSTLPFPTRPRSIPILFPLLRSRMIQRRHLDFWVTTTRALIPPRWHPQPNRGAVSI